MITDIIRAALENTVREPVAYWIPKAEQFCIADPGGRPFAKAWQPLYAAPLLGQDLYILLNALKKIADSSPDDTAHFSTALARDALSAYSSPYDTELCAKFDDNFLVEWSAPIPDGEYILVSKK